MSASQNILHLLLLVVVTPVYVIFELCERFKWRKEEALLSLHPFPRYRKVRQLLINIFFYMGRE